MKKINPLFCLLALILGFLLSPLKSISQESSITIKVINQKREPLAFASVKITNHPDTLKMQQKVADSSGVAIFKLTKGEKYSVSISSINYQPIEKGITIGNQTVYTYQAEPLPRSLRGVVVTAQKPLMKQEDDKTIIEPEALAASSTNSYEVIEKTPGLFVDQDGNIYISSLSPATVQINGRDMKMSAADVATLLKSLPPNAISRIEVVRTPSAKYDASSSGGIVNVVLRKGVKLGMTGSVNTGWQQGTYGNKFLGFTLNNNDGKKSSFINFNYSKRKTFEKTITDRLFAPDSLLSQNAYAKYNTDSWFGSYSLVFPVSKKLDLDLSTSANLNLFDNNTDNRNIVKKISTSQTISDNLNFVNNKGTSLNIRAAVSAKLKLDSLGSDWVNDVFYNYSRNNADQLFFSNYSTPIPFTSGGDGNNTNDRHFAHYQTDLKLRLAKKFTLEAGGKTTFLRFKSLADYYRGLDPNREKDPNRTNSFNYDENINSLYVQGSKTLGKDFVIKAGTRMENTNMKGNQLIPFDTSFTIHRTDLFPYLYLSKNLMKIAGYDLRAYLIYRRTISRPVYEQLNPFPRYVDQYLTEIGNPALKPQFTTNYEANISVDERPILAIGVNETKDIFTNVIYQSDTSLSQAYRTYDNLGKNKEWYLRGLGALPPGGKYFFVFGAQYNHNFYEGLYENKPLSFKRGSWVLFTYHQLKLDRFSQLTLNGFVRFKGQQQFYELGTFGSLNASINRQFFNQKLIVTLSVNDMFYSQKIDFSIKQGTVDATGSRIADSRRFGINLRYNFGIRKKEDNNMFNMEPPGAN